MKILYIAAGTLLFLGLSGTAYAKCGGGGMMMKGDFKTQKSRMLNNLNEMEKCVEAATSKQDLKECRMKMMQKKMQQAKPGAMQCGAGKCGGGK